MLSVWVSIWTEAHKICKALVLITQILPRCFCSCGLWLSKSNNRGKQVDVSEPTDINQSISKNQFYSIKALILMQKFFCFPIIHHNSTFSTHVKRACYFQVNICLLKLKSRNTRTRCEICSKLAIKTPGRCHWRLYC